MKMILLAFLLSLNIAYAQNTYMDLRGTPENNPSMSDIDAITLVGDELYVNSASSTVVSNGIYLYGGVFKIQKSTKKILWKYRPERGSLVGQPAIYRDNILIGSTQGVVHVISKDSGELLTTVETKYPQGAYECCNSESSILVVGDMAYYAAEKLYGIDLKQMKVRFVSEVSAYSNSARIKPIYKNNTVFFNCSDGICAIDTKSGDLKWKRYKMDGFGYYNRIWGNPQFDEDGNILFAVSNPVGIAKLNSKTGETIFANRFFNHFKRSSGYSNIMITPQGYIQRTRQGELLYTNKKGELVDDKPITANSIYMNFHRTKKYTFVASFYGRIVAIHNQKGKVTEQKQIALEPTESVTAQIFSDDKNIYIPISSGRIVEFLIDSFAF